MALQNLPSLDHNSSFSIKTGVSIASAKHNNNNNNSIQFNSILIYLRANLTAQRPITKLARVRSKKQQYIYK
jgi:hypothetical protein